MARLIDAEVLLEDNTWEWFDEWGNYTSAGQAIAAAPTVDAAPVVHGEWIDGTCNNCGQVDFSKPNYCPNCGAKMDGGDKA